VSASGRGTLLDLFNEISAQIGGGGGMGREQTRSLHTDGRPPVSQANWW